MSQLYASLNTTFAQNSKVMLDFLKKLVGAGSSVDYGELIQNGAVIIDVRTPGEFAGGHIKQSVNIPLDKLQGSIKKIKAKGPIIVCCASGMRSGSAKSILQRNGFTDVHNAGSWTNLRKYER